MPTVPIPEQDLQARGPMTFQAGDVKPVQDFSGKQLSDFGNTLTKVSVDVMQEVNQSRTAEALNQFNNRVLDRQLEAFKLKGKDALSGVNGQAMPDFYTNELSKDAAEIAKGLGNDNQRRAFMTKASDGMVRFRGVLNTHLIEQQKLYDNETDSAALNTATRNAGLAQSAVDPANIATVQAANNAWVQATADISTTIDRIAKRNGWDDKIKEAKLVEAMSAMHMGIIKGMIETNRPAEAEAHFKANKGMLTVAAREEMGKVVKAGLDIKTAEDAADSVWARIGPKSINEPVKIFDMEAELRKELKDNATAMKNGIAALRERAGAFNAQQSEVNAANTNAVFGLIDSGKPMTQVQRSAAWLALPEAKRHEITKAMESGDSLLQSNAGEYLTVTDPQVLSRMTRAQVEELRTKFGVTATRQLLDRWDNLQKPGKMDEAKMDKQDFDMVADQLGLKPYDPKKSENERRGLGMLQYRVENVILVEQRQQGRPLTREEKMNVMRREMATTVAVDGWFKDSQVPIINLTPDQLDKVVVPQGDRTRITAKMAKRFQETNGDARFAPTEANLRYWYMVEKSPAANLIRQK